MMTEQEIHLALHKAGVEIIHRPDNMISRLASLDVATTRTVRRIVNQYDIPQIPADRVIQTLTGKGI